MVSLKPTDELFVSATAIALVYAIFSNGTPGYADVRADDKNNVNTHKSTKMAAVTSVAAVGSLALLGKAPGVWVAGGAAILFETWKMHYANYAVNGTEETAASKAMG